jgi:hypothetical protein
MFATAVALRLLRLLSTAGVLTPAELAQLNTATRNAAVRFATPEPEEEAEWLARPMQFEAATDEEAWAQLENPRLEDRWRSVQRMWHTMLCDMLSARDP